ncbi:MAG: DEAD/DEAH box helicase [Atopobiaceae bacterium]|jgi:hypothetical protein|nr:DEAD/DEAH box helicase [Atopobiaceae bacterium]
MIGEPQIKRKLQYAKAKAKLAEFSIPRGQYPPFKSDSDDLCFNAMHALSSYANAILASRLPDDDETGELKRAASFYDAASNSDDHEWCKDGFWLLAMSTYFLLENFGSAAVASDHIGDPSCYGPMGTKLFHLVRYLLKGEGPSEKMGLPRLIEYVQGGDTGPEEVAEEASRLLNNDNAEDHLFGKVCYVAIGIAVRFAARSLLPELSNLDITSWKPYLSSKGACHLLWQAQERIAKAGALAGKSLFVQLPTGTGKTRSIQLLIRSRVIAGECKQAIVMAPLRALCSEIARDLTDTVSDIVDVRQSTDVLELDAWLDSKTSRPRVMVFTPEKFAYVERHAGGLINSTDLFILDEAHLIDDPSRGPAYELTIAEIRQKKPKAQMVMLSAVVSNPDEIAAWAMGDSKSCVSDEGIPRTEKSLGITSVHDNQVGFWDLATGGEREFYIPLSFEVQWLPCIGRERTQRQFPDLREKKGGPVPSREIALYMAEKVVDNGPVAIYLPQARYVTTYFDRLQELHDHSCQLPRLGGSFDRGEGQRICRLADRHYGDGEGGDPFKGGISMGVLPHYGDLQGCLRQVVEAEVEKGRYKCVACTSTLAQGVNLPIKYLIITGVQNGNMEVKTRDFQNLIGRTARSGKFSEGSILISDSSRSRWCGSNDYNRLLDEKQSEACVSAIARLFDDLDVEKDNEVIDRIPGKKVVNLMLEGLAMRDASVALIEHIARSGLSVAEAKRCVANRVHTFSAIETYVSGMLDQALDDIDAVSLSVSTFAYSRADDTMQDLLMKLFEAICEALRDANTRLPLAIYSKTQMGVAKTELLASWLRSPDGDAFLAASNDQERIPLICKAYQQCLGIGDEWLDYTELADLTNMWIHGETIATMVSQLEERHRFSPRKGPNIQKVEKALGRDIGYKLANFISCVGDVLEPILGDAMSADLSESLALLHEKVKFGVESPLGCSVCREIFADRMVADDLVGILGNADQGSNDALGMLMLSHKREVEEYLAGLPFYFENRYKTWKRHLE